MKRYPWKAPARGRCRYGERAVMQKVSCREKERYCSKDRMKRRGCRVGRVRKTRDERKIGKSRAKKQAWVMRANDGKHNADDEERRIVISQRY